jgi:hypothetical protein
VDFSTTTSTGPPPTVICLLGGSAAGCEQLRAVGGVLARAGGDEGVLREAGTGHHPSTRRLPRVC